MKTKIIVHGIEIGTFDIDDPLAWVQDNLEAIPIPDISVDFSDTAMQILAEMQEAIKKCGTYHWEDRGAHECMDIDKWVEIFKNQDPNTVRVILEEVFDSSKYGQRCANAIVSNLDGQPIEWWEDLMSGNKLEY